MIYSDWTKTNTGIFYQINRVQALPFAIDTMTIENLDQDFLMENANKEMFSSDTDMIVKSILGALFPRWQDLTAFYKSLTPGTISEVSSKSAHTVQNTNQIALNDSEDMVNTGGNGSDAKVEASSETKNYIEYHKYFLSNDLYDIIKKQLRNYLFINVY